MAYSIEAAQVSGCFDEVMVSTDDDGIAAVALSLGASVPFMRSAETSNDTATIADALLEVIRGYEDRSRCFDHLCCVLATAPFVTPEAIRSAFDIFSEGRFDSVVPIVRFDYPILRALKRDGDRISMFWPEHLDARSQDLPPAYHDAGLFYWADVRRLKESRTIFMPDSGSIVLEASMAQDIDTEEDWKVAEFKFRYARRT